MVILPIYCSLTLGDTPASINSFGIWLRSVALLTDGFQGGGIFLASNFSQSIWSKNGWRFISATSSGPLPKRSLALFRNN